MPLTASRRSTGMFMKELEKEHSVQGTSRLDNSRLDGLATGASYYCAAASSTSSFAP